MRAKKEKLMTEVRKLGHSLGIIIPPKFAKKLDLKEHEKIEVEVKKVNSAEELFGKFHFREPTEEIKREIKEGWGD